MNTAANNPGGRVPPNDLDCEAAVLSACLLDALAYDRVQAMLQARHFYADANRRVYEAIADLNEHGLPIDVIAVANWLRDRQHLQSIGGTPYLAQLSDATPAVAHVENHAQVIIDKWAVRQVISTCQGIAIEGYGDTGITAEWLQDVDARVHSVTRREALDKNVTLIGIAAADETKRIGERQANKGAMVTGIPTGLPTLDARLRGMQVGCKYTLAARPGHGKTSAALGISIAAAAQGYPVVFCSLEMPRDQLALRALSQESNIDSQKLATGKITDEQFKDLTAACVQIGKLPIVIFDQSTQTVASVRASVREGRRILTERYPNVKKTVLVVIDFLQIIDAGERATGNDVKDLAMITLGTAQLAKDEECVVLELSQLNRDLEKRPRDDRRPRLSDLRGAGQIEENTFSVVFLYRDDEYKKEHEDPDNIGEFIVAKNRAGSKGIVRVKFKAPTTYFFEESRNPDYKQLGDIFDDYIPGTSGEPFPDLDANPPRDWRDDY